MNRNILNKCIAELLGTFALVFFGCGAMILYEINLVAISVDLIPIVFGVVVAVMICTFADISKIRNKLKWKPKVKIERGIKILLNNLDYWKKAPVWTPTKINNAIAVTALISNIPENNEIT